MNYNYSNQQLNNVFLKNQTIIDADFSNTKLAGADFTCSVMRDANFNSASSANIIFTNADLDCANFNNSNFVDTDFSNAKLAGADFTYAILKNTNFKNANIRGCDFSNAILIDSDFTSAEMGKGFSKGFLETIIGIMFALLLGLDIFGSGSTMGTTFDSNKTYQSIGAHIIFTIMSVVGVCLFSQSLFISIRENDLLSILLSFLVVSICFVLFVFNIFESVNLVNKESGTKFYKTNFTNVKFNNVVIENTDFTNATFSNVDWTNAKGDIPSI